jgi:hypothetical protein
MAMGMSSHAPVNHRGSVPMLISHLLPIDRLAALSIGRADARLPEESVLPLQLGTALK